MASFAPKTVVNCAGMWARDIALQVGVDMPLQACEHFYVVTDLMEGMHPSLPVMRDMDHCSYFKEDAGKLLVGCIRARCETMERRMESPKNFCLRASCRRIGSIWRQCSMTRCAAFPRSKKVGIRKFFNGPESFTVDGRYILGPAPEVENFFVGAGFNLIGIQSGGGAGLALACWIALRAPSRSIFGRWMLPRFFPHQNKKSSCASASYQSRSGFSMRFFGCPTNDNVTGRAHPSPLHERLAACWCPLRRSGGLRAAQTGMVCRAKNPKFRLFPYGRQNGSTPRATSMSPYGSASGCSTNRALQNSL